MELMELIALFSRKQCPHNIARKHFIIHPINLFLNSFFFQGLFVSWQFLMRSAQRQKTTKKKMTGTQIFSERDQSLPQTNQQQVASCMMPTKSFASTLGIMAFPQTVFLSRISQHPDVTKKRTRKGKHYNGV